MAANNSKGKEVVTVNSGESDQVLIDSSDCNYCSLDSYLLRRNELLENHFNNLNIAWKDMLLEVQQLREENRILHEQMKNVEIESTYILGKIQETLKLPAPAYIINMNPDVETYKGSVDLILDSLSKIKRFEVDIERCLFYEANEDVSKEAIEEMVMKHELEIDDYNNNWKKVLTDRCNGLEDTNKLLNETISKLDAKVSRLKVGLIGWRTLKVVSGEDVKILE